MKLPVSRAVEAAFGGAEGGSDLLWLDPRAARSDGPRGRGARPAPPTDAVVFIVGGGNYIEYHNLLDFAKCCARGRPIIVEWERDARHSAGLSLVRLNSTKNSTKLKARAPCAVIYLQVTLDVVRNGKGGIDFPHAFPSPLKKRGKLSQIIA
ncbi:Protein sly1 homolog [Eumeta japonica]|uniref:Protein sly1 homolog n=1 Tax=Eumeta variegata TaxID=151549 RepID=A0A4C1XGA4_EUMVA|nr:Protein sly1 homolog [Eumeta japonica]